MSQAQGGVSKQQVCSLDWSIIPHEKATGEHAGSWAAAAARSGNMQFSF